MRCAACTDPELVEHIRDGIDVRECPSCRGIWLERVELRKLLDLVEARSPEPRITTPEPPHAPDEKRGGHRRHRRRGSVVETLEEVFDLYE